MFQDPFKVPYFSVFIFLYIIFCFGLLFGSSHVDAHSREAIGPAVERSIDVLVRDDLKGPREPHGFAVKGNHIERVYGVLPSHLLDDEFRVSSYSQPANALILGCKQAFKQCAVLCFVVGHREFSDGPAFRRDFNPAHVVSYVKSKSPTARIGGSGAIKVKRCLGLQRRRRSIGEHLLAHMASIRDGGVHETLLAIRMAGRFLMLSEGSQTGKPPRTIDTMISIPVVSAGVEVL